MLPHGQSTVAIPQSDVVTARPTQLPQQPRDVMGQLALIGLDWGTTTLRVYGFSAAGEAYLHAESPHGILSVPDGRFEACMRSAAGELLDAAADTPILASGMIGSRQGWCEAPYARCPAGLMTLADALALLELSDGRRIHFVPGLKFEDGDGVPDVMRGEETQILGTLGDGANAIAPMQPQPESPKLLVLPGTHSKWAKCRKGRIDGFMTFMTGELFGALREHTILGRLADDSVHDAQCFARGVNYAQLETPGRGGLLKRVFSTRTLGLFERLPPSGAAAYLSGLLIGTEIVEALAGFMAGQTPTEVTVVGGDTLSGPYVEALSMFDIRAVAAPAHAAARGHWHVALAAGLCHA